MFLREYVYVDVDKVRGLASQLYDGVPERATNVSARQKRLELDLKLVRAGQDSGTNDSVERSLGDSMFKDVEADLEAIGLLKDLSQELASEGSWQDIEALVKPGAILRITARGTLFHPAQLHEAILGMATAALGLRDVGVESLPNIASLPPRAKTPAQKRNERTVRSNAQIEPRYPEDHLPNEDTIPIMETPRAQLAGMIRVIRGIFGDGLHLHLRPLGVEGPAISARLEQGRRFMDSSPEVLFSRYGLGPQDWTVVGVVGQMGRGVSLEDITITNADDSVNRPRTVDLIDQFLGNARGLVDVPQKPGFSFIPLAVYRAIGEGFATD